MSEIEKPIPAGGFNPFEDEPEPTEGERIVQTDELEKIEDIALSVFGKGQGKTYLAYLRSRTEQAPGFMAEMGLLNGIAWGFTREGQNSIVRHIDDQMANALTRRSK